MSWRKAGLRKAGSSGFLRFHQFDENGVDLTAIRDNLRLTPQQRLASAESRRRGIESLHRYRTEIRDRIASGSGSLKLSDLIDAIGLTGTLRIWRSGKTTVHDSAPRRWLSGTPRSPGFFSSGAGSCNTI
jgi:hypothetical protein